MKTISFLITAFLLVQTQTNQAIPLKLEMVTDELKHGKAVLQGNLPGIPWIGDEWLIFASLPSGATPENWQLKIELERYITIGTDFNYRISDIDGLHISKPAPDPGESSPGPPLDLGLSGAPFKNLTGFGSPPNPLSQQIELSHDGHWDSMVATLLDLNPDSDSVLSGGEIRINIEFWHSGEKRLPETGTTAFLLLVGFSFFTASRPLMRKRPEDQNGRNCSGTAM